LRIKGIGWGFVVVAGSMLLASAALAGFVEQRLNGVFELQDKNEGTSNQGCVAPLGQTMIVLGDASETTADGCLVTLNYQTTLPNKASMSSTKDDGTGSAKISQQLNTLVGATIVNVDACTVPNYTGSAFPEKCKANGSVKGDNDDDSVDNGKISVNCQLGSDGSELEPSPSTEQVDKIVEAFADRKDVKVSDTGNVKINLKGEQGVACD
jgi:hypothetical protein